MRAVQVVEYNKPYQINTVAVPQPGPHDIIVKVAVASYCHTDALVASGVFGTQLPVTASHEGSGTVAAIGSAVTTFKPGDRVMCGIPLHPCDKCLDCTGPEEGWRQYCMHTAGHVGVHTDGCLAEYVRVDERMSTHVPDSVSLLFSAPLACAGRTIWRGVAQAQLKPGDWLAIVGAGGGLGHLGIQFAKTQGIKVIAIDARDQGLTLSSEYGADVVVDAREGKDAVVEQVKRVTSGKGADSSIVLTDAADGTALSAAVTRMHGTVIQIALPENVSVPFHELIFRDIRLKGSLLASAGESDAMMESIAKHGIKVKTVVFEGLDKIDELLQAVHGGKIQGKAVVVVDLEQIEAEKNLGAGH